MDRKDSERAKQFPHLRAAFRTNVEQFGPNDFFVMQKCMKEVGLATAATRHSSPSIIIACCSLALEARSSTGGTAVACSTYTRPDMFALYILGVLFVVRPPAPPTSCAKILVPQRQATVSFRRQWVLCFVCVNKLQQ